ncbi:hypothetical protein Droror1_Dr00002403 [Drosera rotundifolia]
MFEKSRNDETPETLEIETHLVKAATAAAMGTGSEARAGGGDEGGIGEEEEEEEGEGEEREKTRAFRSGVELERVTWNHQEQPFPTKPNFSLTLSRLLLSSIPGAAAALPLSLSCLDRRRSSPPPPATSSRVCSSNRVNLSKQAHRPFSSTHCPKNIFSLLSLKSLPPSPYHTQTLKVAEAAAAGGDFGIRRRDEEAMNAEAMSGGGGEDGGNDSGSWEEEREESV